MTSISPDSPQDNPEYERAVRRLKIAAKSVCAKCGTHPQMGKGYSFPSWCRQCHNEYKREYSKKNYTPAKGRKANLRRNYGLTPYEYDLMFFRQGGVCAACGKPETIVNRWTGEIQALGVDHNHELGEVRELLCNACNALLGYIERDRERVRRLLKYLKKHDI